MKNYQQILILVVVIAIGILAFVLADKKTTEVAATPNLVGCYQATIEQDVYTLNIQSQEKNTVGGTLTFKNFQKDSSSGSFSGSYVDGVLVGDYAFQSEGTNSVMEVAFKKSGDNMIRGVGDMGEDGTHFADLKTVIYDASSPLNVFKKVVCPPVATTQIIFPTGGENLHSGNSYELKWKGAEGEVIAIFLIDASMKSAGASVSSVDRLYGIANTGSYTYTLPKNLDAGTYEFQIGNATSNTFMVVSK